MKTLASTWIHRIMKQHQILLSESNNVLWGKCENQRNELDKIKKIETYLNEKIDEINKNFEKHFNVV